MTGGAAWIAIALAAEAASMWAAAQLLTATLRAGGVRSSRWRTTGLTYESYAFSYTLPAGGAISSAYRYRRLRRLGASAPLALFALVAVAVTSGLAFLALTTVLGAGADSDQVTLSLLALLLGALGLVAGIGVLAWRRPQTLERTVVRALRTMRPLLRKPTTNLDATDVHRLLADLRGVRPSAPLLLAAFALALVSWAADVACLAATCELAGVGHLTVTSLMTSYIAGAGAAAISLLPSGLGYADVAMIVPLTYGGASLGQATLAIVLYRVVSYGLVSAVGWGLWGRRWLRTQRLFGVLSRHPGDDAVVGAKHEVVQVGGRNRAKHRKLRRRVLVTEHVQRPVLDRPAAQMGMVEAGAEVSTQLDRRHVRALLLEPRERPRCPATVRISL
jgi:uncharacterized protein (TIRG00374 family)